MREVTVIGGLRLNRFRIKITAFLSLLLLPATDAFMQAPAASFPESLLLEVVTAPGYAFMDGCADPVMMSGQPMAGSAATTIAPAAAAGPAGEPDHAAHHPGGTASAPSAPVPDERLREKIAEELDRATRLFGTLREGPAGL